MSEAMILAAEGSDKTASILTPPENVQLGEPIFLEGGTPSTATDKELPANVWESVGELLKVQKGKATYNGKVLVSSKGQILVPNMPDGTTIK